MQEKVLKLLLDLSTINYFLKSSYFFLKNLFKKKKKANFLLLLPLYPRKNTVQDKQEWETLVSKASVSKN